MLNYLYHRMVGMISTQKWMIMDYVLSLWFTNPWSKRSKWLDYHRLYWVFKVHESFRIMKAWDNSGRTGRTPKEVQICCSPQQDDSTTHLTWVPFDGGISPKKRLLSGKLRTSYGKPPSFIGKSPVNGPCSIIAMLNYQKVSVSGIIWVSPTIW